MLIYLDTGCSVSLALKLLRNVQHFKVKVVWREVAHTFIVFICI